ncbi:hypothetical protein HYV21_00065 [Candidatus Microgenomates bacterium]|nr:hypothetical protein [Candidatus Microgenomates bacterium]
MKLNEQAFANASAILTGLVYLVCSLLVALFPDFFRIVSQSWFHGINLETIWTGSARGNFLLGLITAVVGTWLTGWAFAWVYNKLSK